MLGTNFGAMVMGIDIHFVAGQPAPPLIPPHPWPVPFMGMVFDSSTVASVVPGGPAVVLAAAIISAPSGSRLATAVGAVASGQAGAAYDQATHASGGPVMYGGAFAANTSMKASALLHLLLPPGTYLINPDKDAHLTYGSDTVYISGRRAVRLSDSAEGCGDPMRMPTCTVSTNVVSAMVLVGGSPTQDERASTAAAMETAAGRAVVGYALGSVTPSRLRNAVNTDDCTSTGHPVDVATGRMFTSQIDWELPGPLPLAFKRLYCSAVCDRDSSVGYGWNHALEQSVWLERGRVVFRGGDGREIEFDTFDSPQHRIAAGQSVFEPMSRLTLTCHGDNRWTIETADGQISQFAAVAGDVEPAVAKLLRIATRDGHEVQLQYGASGLLEWVRDSCGRLVKFDHDANRRIASISLPHPTERGWIVNTRYEYSPAGELLAVTDAIGEVTRYDYDGHLMVRETDRTGLSFYFGYDGRDSEAWCIRTWGDGGLFDHVIDYDHAKRVTVVTNSRGHARIFKMNEVLAVVEVIDAHGAKQITEYDDFLRKVSTVDEVGGETKSEYDTKGNLVRSVGADGAEVRIEYDARNEPTRAVDPVGGEWQFAYDDHGHLTATRNPLGDVVQYGYRDGMLAWILANNEARTEITYDEARNVRRIVAPTQAETYILHDNLGRPVGVRDERGAESEIQYDARGRVVRETNPLGVVERRYDGEDNLLEERSPRGTVRFRYSGFHKLAEQDHEGGVTRLEYDTEDDLVAVVNERGERYCFALDACGRVQQETGFDGLARRHQRDPAGRVVRTVLPSLAEAKYTYDKAGRIAEIERGGDKERFVYRADGALIEARGPAATVRFERDALGRVVREWQGEDWVATRYGRAGAREQVASSLGAHAVEVRDVAGDVSEIHVGHGETWRYRVGIARDVGGLETARDLPGGVRAETSRDAVGRVAGQRVVRGGGAEAWEKAYRWSAADWIDAVVDSARGMTRYAHDRRGKLTGSQSPNGQVLLRIADEVGNLFKREDRADREYGPGGRVLRADGATYAYDADGRMAERRDGAGRWRYEWDGADRLKRVVRPDRTAVGFAYDALGRRVEKRIDDAADAAVVRWVWDGDVVLHEVSSEAPLATWHWEPERFAPVAKVQAGRAYGVVTDHLGTPSELYDEAGRVAWQMQLDVYGVAHEEGERGACPWRWPGQYEDAETGLYYNRFRYYDPGLGRYLSEDPIGLLGGLALWGYVGDPGIEIDPLGLKTCADLAASGRKGEYFHVVRADDERLIMVSGPMTRSNALAVMRRIIRAPKRSGIRERQGVYTARKGDARSLAASVGRGRAELDPPHEIGDTGSISGAFQHYHPADRPGGHVWFGRPAR